MSESRRVVVVGGGIAGLTTAYRLMRDGVGVFLFEAADTAGGRIATVDVGDLRLEAGPDSFVARKPWAVDLCRELGIADELVRPGASGAYLWTDAGLVRCLKDAPFGILGDIGDVLRWPGLTRSGRWRAAQDLVRRKRKDGFEETLGGLLRRRLGDEATDAAIAPLLAGLYAGDVEELSAPATFPELVEWEAAQGSLIRGSQAATRAAARADAGAMFLRPRGGVGRLVEALVAALGPDHVRTGAPVASIDEQIGDADAIVLATPAFESAQLLRGRAPEAARELDAIPYASTGVVFLVYPEGTHDAFPEGTGFVVPRGKAPMTACTWISRKWPDPIYRTRAVARCYVGGAGDEDVLDEPDGDLIDACSRHLKAVLDLPAAPEYAAVVRWPRSMPQYTLGHLDRVRRARGALPPGIFVVGNAFDGVGIPDTIRGATKVASDIAAGLSPTHTIEETVR